MKYRAVVETYLSLNELGFPFEFTKNNDKTNNLYYSIHGKEISVEDIVKISNMAKYNGFSISCENDYIFINIGKSGYIGYVVNKIKEKLESKILIDIDKGNIFIILNSYEQIVTLNAICKSKGINVYYSKADNQNIKCILSI